METGAIERIVYLAGETEIKKPFHLPRMVKERVVGILGDRARG
jgi:hypothetical protein